MSDSIYAEKLKDEMAERTADLERRRDSLRQNIFSNPEGVNSSVTPPPVTAQKLERELDIVSRDSIHNEMSSLQTNIFRGFNTLGYQAPVPINKEQYGYTFFTRPRMNLNDENLLYNRKLAQLITKTSNTMGSAIRAYLDFPGHKGGEFRSDVVDKQNTFIPLLGNTIESLSGFPDPVIDTYTAPPGLRKETWMMYDGVIEIRNEYPLTATFRNISRDPVSFLFDMWLQYGSGVRLGSFEPRYTSMFFHELDYQTRVWRIVLNEHRTHVAKIAACSAAIPVNISLGKAFDFNNNAPFNQGNSSVNVQFLAVGATYNDPILFKEFNETVIMGNSNMRDGVRDRFYKKLPHGLTPVFNYKAYPRINIDTLEFEWWVDYETYFSVLPEDADS